ncbi:MAG: sigma-70 family RNA polymerase sigma factor [Rhodanobacteraceae bacterium]
MNAAAARDKDDLTRILRAVAGGDQAAFAELYRRTSSKLFGVCLRMLHERGEAEDALQDVYTAVWRRAESFDAARAGAMTWLITMARNRAIDRLRQRRDAPLDDASERELVDDQPTPAANTETSQQRQRLERCLDTLEPQQKSSVRAAFFSGATYNELATRGGVPLATMKSWIRRSLVRLRACLEHLNP